MNPFPFVWPKKHPILKIFVTVLVFVSVILLIDRVAIARFDPDKLPEREPIDYTAGIAVDEIKLYRCEDIEGVIRLDGHMLVVTNAGNLFLYKTSGELKTKMYAPNSGIIDKEGSFGVLNDGVVYFYDFDGSYLYNAPYSGSGLNVKVPIQSLKSDSGAWFSVETGKVWQRVVRTENKEPVTLLKHWHLGFSLWRIPQIAFTVLLFAVFLLYCLMNIEVKKKWDERFLKWLTGDIT